MTDYQKFRDPRLNRLAVEHQLLDDFCQQSERVSYEPVGQRRGMPPEKYLLHYALRSITGVDPTQMPIYGEKHTAEITIPAKFPLAEQPKCWMVTKLWHPNVKFSGDFSGKICINAEALGHWHTLDMLAERIGEMIQYKNYHAENTHPHPEDAAVARWVREFAEPRDIVNKKKRIYTDNSMLLNPSQDWIESRKKKIEIQILGKRPSKEPDAVDYSKYYDIANKRKQISVKKKQ